MNAELSIPPDARSRMSMLARHLSRFEAASAANRADAKSDTAYRRGTAGEATTTARMARQ